MKAQFAFMEAMVGLIVVLVLITFYSTQIIPASSDAYAAISTLRNSAAIYDFQQQLSTNKSFRTCILSTGSCLNSYIYQYREIFDLKSVAFEVNGARMGNTTVAAYSRCFPLFMNQSPQTICILIGD